MPTIDDDALAEFIAGAIATLHAQSRVGLSRAKAALSALRGAAGKTMIDAPEAWDHTLEGMPEHLLGDGDEPSRAEEAAYTALTLYAVHQQSRPDSVNARGVSLGAAARKLALVTGTSRQNPEPPRRFTSIVTAESRDTLNHHLRGLIQQLRAHGIGLDYAMLAVDLARLGDDRRHNLDARLRWTRDFHSPASATKKSRTARTKTN